MAKSKKEDKTELMAFRVTLKEKEIIERHAEKEGMSVSQYMRATILMTMAIEGNVDAMKIIFTSVGENIKDAVNSKFKIKMSNAEVA